MDWHSWLLLRQHAIDCLGYPSAADTPLAECDCDTLRHMSRRRSATSLPSYQAVSTAERHEATHREIVAAAVHAFRVRGYAATTMSTVAAIAGVSPRTLYRYFGGKSELFAATVEEVNAEFLQRLSERIQTSPIHDAIIGAAENAYRELNGEIREMMRLTAADQNAWRYFLGTASRMQSTLAAALRSAAGQDEGGGRTDEQLVWEVRASALLGAISTAYRQWATSPGSELSDLIAVAVEVVLPAVAIHPAPDNASPSDSRAD